MQTSRRNSTLKIENFKFNPVNCLHLPNSFTQIYLDKVLLIWSGNHCSHLRLECDFRDWWLVIKLSAGSDDGNNQSLNFAWNLGKLSKILCKPSLWDFNTYNTFDKKLWFCSPKQSFPATIEQISRQKRIASYQCINKILRFHEYKLKYITKTQDRH